MQKNNEIEILSQQIKDSYSLCERISGRSEVTGAAAGKCRDE